MLSRILMLLSLALTSAPAFAQSSGMTMEGSLPRDLSEGRFRLTITVTGLTQAMVDRGASDGSGNDLLKARFAIKLAGSNEDTPIDQATGATDGRQTKFYMQEGQPYVSDPADVTNGAGLHSQRYFIDIIEAVPGELKSKADSSKTLSIAVFFYLGFAQNKDAVYKIDPPQAIKQEIYLINAQPEFAGSAPIAGSHKSLIVSWNVKTGLGTIGGDAGLTRDPSNVVVYVLHPDVGSQGLPAKVFSGSAGAADTEGSCQYTKPAATEAATCVTCGEKTYLNRAAIKDLLGDKVTIVTGKNSDGQVKVDGLDNDVSAPYTVFMQYLPDGLGASQCLPGLPSANFTLTELNGEGDAEVVDFRCFIATAAYGSPMAEELKYFRKFRSHVLLKSALGRSFVHYYYEYSPPVARYISEHPTLRDAVRAVLEVPAKILESVDEYY